MGGGNWFLKGTGAGKKKIKKNNKILYQLLIFTHMYCTYKINNVLICMSTNLVHEGRDHGAELVDDVAFVPPTFPSLFSNCQ